MVDVICDVICGTVFSEFLSPFPIMSYSPLDLQPFRSMPANVSPSDNSDFGRCSVIRAIGIAECYGVESFHIIQTL